MSFPVLDIVATAYDSARLPHLDFSGSDESSEKNGQVWLANLRTGSLITVSLPDYFVPDGAIRIPFTVIPHDAVVCGYGRGYYCDSCAEPCDCTCHYGPDRVTACGSPMWDAWDRVFIPCC